MCQTFTAIVGIGPHHGPVGRYHQPSSRSEKQTHGAEASPNRRRKEHPWLLSIRGVWVGLTLVIQTQPTLSSQPPTTS